MKSATLPANVETLGGGAFEKCGALSTLEILGPLNVLENSTFKYCGALSSIKLPKTLQKIESNAFWKCGALSTLDLPEGLGGVGPGAFADCGVKKLRLQASFDGAGSSSPSGHIPFFGFNGASELELEVDPKHLKLISRDGCVLTRDGKTLLWGPIGREGVGVVPEGVETIADAKSPTPASRAASRWKSGTPCGNSRNASLRRFETFERKEGDVDEV